MCYIFSVDGTKSYGAGRMVNDSHTYSNCKMVVVEDSRHVFLCLFAKADLDAGTELRYDYGELPKRNLYWRKDVRNILCT